MAKYKESIYLPELRGRDGASIFRKNRYGNHIAPKPIPSNHKTDAQMRVRYSLTSLIKIYSNKLNERQYIGWSKLTSKITLSDKSGNIFHPAPRDIFTGFNSNLTEVGLPISLDPPEKLSVQSFKSFDVQIIPEDNNNDLLLFFKPAIDKDTRIMIFATKDLKNSIFFFRPNRFKLIGYIDSTFKSGDSFLSLYRSILKFNYKFYDNFKIAFHFKPVSCSSGYSKDLVEISSSIFPEDIQSL